ncbi:NAD(P)H-binding protein [Salininema proteolyticum]|uniref:NAD(P)H-binding protein n=1 Tax=Salininema proteolyticum TaxID=1607685 RepID=A0ABV8U3Y8_9ACTN
MIGVTVTSSPIGALVIEKLLEREVPAERIVALVQDEAGAEGVRVEKRPVDVDVPATLHEALRGVEKLVFIPTSEVGQRLKQADNVVNAAKYEGVGLLAYLSILNAETNGMAVATEHEATEQFIKRSEIPHVFLRHSWYLENFTHYVPRYLDTGRIYGAAGKGRIAAAGRVDVAEAAAVLMTEDHGVDRAFELAGDEPFTYEEFAEMLTRESGTPVAYENLDPDALKETLQEQGVGLEAASMKADRDAGVARGDLDSMSSDLPDLLSRPTKSLREAIREALQG